MADLTPVSTRPTPLSEKTLREIAIGFNINVMVFALMLVVTRWPDAAAIDIVKYLGIALIVMALGNLLVVAGMMSPWIGTVKMSGMGVNLDMSGTDAAAPASEGPTS